MYMVYLLWLCFVVGLVLVYAPWWAWYAGLFWGPRFFLFACIPASFALAVRLHYRDASPMIHLLTLLVLCLTFWVGLDAALYSGQSTAIPICYQNFSKLELLCHYTPEFSALWYPFVKHLSPEIPYARYYLCYWLIAFVWLSLPLLRTIIRQGFTILRPLITSSLDLSSWRL